MTAYAVHRSVAPTPVEAFGLRCWARARLYAEGEIALHDAVDALQAAAVRWRLVATLGQDQVHDDGGVPSGAAGAAVSGDTAKERLRRFWIVATTAREKANHEVLRREFMARARSSGLIAAVHNVARRDG